MLRATITLVSVHMCVSVCREGKWISKLEFNICNFELFIVRFSQISFRDYVTSTMLKWINGTMEIFCKAKSATYFEWNITALHFSIFQPFYYAANLQNLLMFVARFEFSIHYIDWNLKIYIVVLSVLLPKKIPYS